jgi:hypothetical protein
MDYFYGLDWDPLAGLKGSHQVRIHMSEFEPRHKPGGAGETQLEILFNPCVENNNILDQFLNNEEAKYFNTQVCESY